MEPTVIFKFAGLFAVVLGSPPGTKPAVRPEVVLVKTDCASGPVHVSHDAVLAVRAKFVSEGKADRVVRVGERAYAIWSIAGQTVSMDGEDRLPAVSTKIPHLTDFDALAGPGAGEVREALLKKDGLGCPIGARVLLGDGRFTPILDNEGGTFVLENTAGKAPYKESVVESVEYRSTLKEVFPTIRIGGKTIKLEGCDAVCEVFVSNEPLEFFAGRAHGAHTNAFYALSSKEFDAPPSLRAPLYLAFDSQVPVAWPKRDWRDYVADRHEPPLCKDNPALFHRK